MDSKTSFFIAIFFLSTLIINAQSFWGMTNQGGDTNNGVIFKTDSNGENYTVFRSMETRTHSSLMQASNGKLYGMSLAGGNPSTEKGTIFEIDLSTEVYTELAYTNCLFGCEPTGTLIEASNGKLYGMTSNGTTPNEGSLFVFDIATNVITRLVSFTGDNGSSPLTNNLLEIDGIIYGLTNSGGVNGDGVLFEYNITSSTYEVKYDFNTIDPGIDPVTGAKPYGGLIKASNGLLYGKTNNGGVNNGGVLFEYNPTTEIYTKIYDFITNNGYQPRGDLLETSPGILYGMTTAGGVNGTGVIFEYNINTNIYINKFEFDDANNTTGKYGFCKLLLADNGKLYGMAANGGANNNGTIFEYNIATQAFVKKHDFEEATGKFPTYTNLIKASSVLGISEKNISSISVYPNPTTNNLHINFKQDDDYSFSIYDISGKEIFHQQKIEINNTFNFSKYTSGIYILRIKDNSTYKVQHIKIIKT